MFRAAALLAGVLVACSGAGYEPIADPPQPPQDASSGDPPPDAALPDKLLPDASREPGDATAAEAAVPDAAPPDAAKPPPDAGPDAACQAAIIFPDPTCEGCMKTRCCAEVTVNNYAACQDLHCRTECGG